MKFFFLLLAQLVALALGAPLPRRRLVAPHPRSLEGVVRADMSAPSSDRRLAARAADNPGSANDPGSAATASVSSEDAAPSTPAPDAFLVHDSSTTVGVMGIERRASDGDLGPVPIGDGGANHAGAIIDVDLAFTVGFVRWGAQKKKKKKNKKNKKKKKNTWEGWSSSIFQTSQFTSHPPPHPRRPESAVLAPQSSPGESAERVKLPVSLTVWTHCPSPEEACSIMGSMAVREGSSIASSAAPSGSSNDTTVHVDDTADAVVLLRATTHSYSLPRVAGMIRTAAAEGGGEDGQAATFAVVAERRAWPRADADGSDGDIVAVIVPVPTALAGGAPRSGPDAGPEDGPVRKPVHPLPAGPEVVVGDFHLSRPDGSSIALHERRPDIAPGADDARGGHDAFLVVMELNYPKSSSTVPGTLEPNYVIASQRISAADGTLIGNVQPVGALENHELRPVVARDADGFVVVFEYDIMADGSDWDLVAQLLEPDGRFHVVHDYVFFVASSLDHESSAHVGFIADTNSFAIVWIAADQVRGRVLNVGAAHIDEDEWTVSVQDDDDNDGGDENANGNGNGNEGQAAPRGAARTVTVATLPRGAAAQGTGDSVVIVWDEVGFEDARCVVDFFFVSFLVILF
jgi:hypothetical protein